MQVKSAKVGEGKEVLRGWEGRPGLLLRKSASTGQCENWVPGRVVYSASHFVPSTHGQIAHSEKN